MKNNFSLRDPEKIVSLKQMREWLVNVLLFNSFIIGTLLFGIALIPAIQLKLTNLIWIYSILYLWMILITFVSRIPYVLRVLSWLAFFYILGTVNLVLSGFNVDAGLFLLSLIVMAAILDGLRGGLLALVISAITISITGFFMVDHPGKLIMGLPQNNPLLWIIGGAIFLLMGLLLTNTLTVIIRGLASNMTKATKLAEELTQANQNLRQSEERYRTLVETSPGLVALIDLDGNIVMVNQPGLALFQIESIDEVVGKNILDLLASEDRARVAEAFHKTVETGVSKGIDCQALRKNGTAFFAEFNSSVIMDANGLPQTVIVVGKDVTKRKQAEQALQEAKELLAKRVEETTVQLQQTTDRLTELVAHSPAVIYSARASGAFDITFVSENVTAISGYEARQFVEDANFWRSHIHMEDVHRVFAEIEHVRESGGVVTEYRFLHKNGGYRWVRDEINLIIDMDGNPLELVGSWVDITERKLAEETRREGEESIQVVFEATSASALLIDAVGIILVINNVAAKRLGKTIKKLRGVCFYDLYPSDVARAKRAQVDEAIRLGKAIRYEDNIRGILFENTIYPIFNEQRRVTKCVLFANDITERRQAEQRLRESEEKYRSLVEQAYDGITIIQDGIIKFSNPQLAELRGEPLNKIIGSRFEKYIHPDERQKVLEYYTRRMAGEKTPSIYESAVVRKDKSKVYVELSTVIIEYGGRPADFVVVHDITDRKRAEAALLQSRDELEDRVAERTAKLMTSQQQLRALTSQMITAQEEERRHISRELHDEAGQALITLKYSLTSIDSELPSDSHVAAKKRLADSVKIIDHTMERIRTLTHSLRPPVLEVGGINLSLKDYCEEFTERTRFPVHYEGLDIYLLPDEIGISLFRFVQESLTNILKHSHATDVKVKLEYRNDSITLSVSDNGRGIENQSRSGGIGLLGIEERLKLLGGNLKIQSRKGRGVKLTAQVPWVLAEVEK